MEKARKEAGSCPYCGSGMLDYDPSEVQDDKLVYPFTCEDCKQAGYEVYHLEFAGFEDKDHTIMD